MKTKLFYAVLILGSLLGMEAAAQGFKITQGGYTLFDFIVLHIM